MAVVRAPAQLPGVHVLRMGLATTAISSMKTQRVGQHAAVRMRRLMAHLLRSLTERPTAELTRERLQS